MSKKLPFTVIGGYLGAGKTTLLNHLLTNAKGLRVAALVNDFGSVNIDVDLIRSHEGDTISLANGCMCCSIADNFALVMGRLRDRCDEFDHIIIEASGVADPAKIALYGQMYELPLDGILVVADAEQVRTQAQNKYVGDTVMRQFTQADLIILNKTDLVSPQELANLHAWLAELSPGTPIIETMQSNVPIDILLGRHAVHMPKDTDFEQLHQENHTHLFKTWTIEQSAPLDQQVIAQFASDLGEDIYRAKGFVYLKDDPDRRYIYQQVGSRWSLEPDNIWGTEPRQTQIVIIGMVNE